MISLDGSTLEGGGQLVRVALCLSAITRIPVRIYNIRANRAPPRFHSNKIIKSGRSGEKSAKSSKPPEGGLKESHLAALNWLAGECDARVKGGSVGSREVVFEPGKGFWREAGWKRKASDGEEVDATIELKNPGSVWLILQAILPYLVLAMHDLGLKANGEGGDNNIKTKKQFKLRLIGGTNVSKSMSGDYVQQVLLPNLKKIGVSTSIIIDVRRRGWAGYASEMGDVIITVEVPKEKFILRGFEDQGRGTVKRICVTLVASDAMRDELRGEVLARLTESMGEEVEIEIVTDEDSGDDRRLYVLLVVKTAQGWKIARDHLGSGKKPKNEREKGLIIQHAAKIVVSELISELGVGGCVDEYMEDQLVIWQALTEGRSVVERPGKGSLHARTVRWVCEEMFRDRGLNFDERGGCMGIACSGGIQTQNFLSDHLDGLRIEEATQSS